MDLAQYDGLAAEFEQYKQENTLKARFKERDDWKALVDRITRDRDRLQEEVQRLESQLHGADNGSDERKTEENDDLGRRKPRANGASAVGSAAAGASDEVLKQKLHQAREEADQARQQLVSAPSFCLGRPFRASSPRTDSCRFKNEHNTKKSCSGCAQR